MKCVKTKSSNNMQKGMTLTEVVVAMALVVLISVLVVSALTVGARISSKSVEQLNLDNFIDALEKCVISDDAKKSLEFYLGIELEEGLTLLCFNKLFQPVSKADSSEYTLRIDISESTLSLTLEQNGEKSVYSAVYSLYK